jgi:gluconokinase
MNCMLIVIMGVSGSGKSTLGRALAARLGWDFVEADDYHSESNRDKMRRGNPLDEADRKPWIDAIVAALKREPSQNQVLACSALTRAIRARLRAELPVPVRFVYLKLTQVHLQARLRQREGHFVGVALLDSQLRTLEEPRDALMLEAERPVMELCREIETGLGVLPIADAGSVAR